jgi:hypothetical protein
VPDAINTIGQVERWTGQRLNGVEEQDEIRLKLRKRGEKGKEVPETIKYLVCIEASLIGERNVYQCRGGSWGKERERERRYMIVYGDYLCNLIQKTNNSSRL